MLRSTALIAVLAGAAGSVGLTLYAGHRNPSRFLMLLFVLWVLSPFAALVVAQGFSKGWSVLTRATLYCIMVILTLGSLTIYAEVALRPPRPKPAAVFLVVPAASWLVIAAAVAIAALKSGRLSRQDDSS